MTDKSIVIATRGSPLALKQAHMAQAALARVAPDIKTSLKVIKTSGDWSPEQGETRLSVEGGGKGMFVKDIQQVLLRGEVDIAVHSMKDTETIQPPGLILAAILPREDARDAMLLRNMTETGQISDSAFSAVPHGAIIGTASVRRQAILLNMRPDLRIVPLRGNVQTRIDKLNSGQVEGTMLAMAGLKRLGLHARANIIIDTAHMLPSAGQGAVGVEMRDPEAFTAESQTLVRLRDILGQISCEDTVITVKAEKQVLAVLDGSCHTPIGTHASIEDNQIVLRVCVLSLDGRRRYDINTSFRLSGGKTLLPEVRKFALAFKETLPDNLLTQSVSKT